MSTYPLQTYQKIFLLLTSFILVALGQPAWLWWIGMLASIFGFALFWRVLLVIPKRSERFVIAMGWYAAVQIVQLSWMTYHPFLYIYAVLLICAWLIGFQFGVIGLFIQPSLFQRMDRLLALAGLWTLLEWSRLFVLSGFSFNPIGLALTSNLYSIQFASLGGVYLLSFWVILVNLLAVRAWLQGFSKKGWLNLVGIALVPYLFGALHLIIQQRAFDEWETQHAPLKVMLVQTAFPVEENLVFSSWEEAVLYVLNEWRHILALIQAHKNRAVDLIVLPEYVVPYGTFRSLYPFEKVKDSFEGFFGSLVLSSFPPLHPPYATHFETEEGNCCLVTNAFIAQTVANTMQADVVVGLEDTTFLTPSTKHVYSCAFHFSPHHSQYNRYEKRVLVPMGEYIPFEFCRNLAAQYGITGSFTCGEKAKIFSAKIPIGSSICYEETYGHLMRENRLLGAEMLVNLTNDAWFPDSLLTKQHFDHARLRTVENGIPLIRSCNTGMTGAVDSLGRIIGMLGEDPIQSQWKKEAYYIEVPTYHYATLYTQVGDQLILAISIFFILFVFIKDKHLINF
jgi:apolipoprotein N-acyltransferase